MQPFVSAKSEKTQIVPTLGTSLCLKGFAMACGGPTYIRSCYRTLETLTWAPNVADEKINLRDETHRSVALMSYLRELIEQLCENDPVSGKKYLPVSFNFSQNNLKIMKLSDVM